LPAPGALPADSLTPVNVDYVHGLSDTVAQTWMPGWLWFGLLLAGLPVLIFMPTHWVLRKFCGGAKGRTEMRRP